VYSRSHLRRTDTLFPWSALRRFVGFTASAKPVAVIAPHCLGSGNESSAWHSGESVFNLLQSSQADQRCKSADSCPLVNSSEASTLPKMAKEKKPFSALE